MSELYDVVKIEIESLIAAVKEDIADKNLTLSEVWTLAQHAISSFIKIADALDANGQDKKEVVVLAAEKLWDEVIGPYDIKKIPNVFEPTFDKFVKSIYMELVKGAIDFIVKFKKG